MKTQINIKEDDKQICIIAPYSTSNNEVYRSRDGKFNRATSAWVFPNSPAVKTMMHELWGSSQELVRVEIDDERIEEFDNEWMLRGYKIASRQGRDSHVRTPDGVQLVKGMWDRSGGSMKHPRVTGEDILLHVVVRKDFALRKELKIVEEQSLVGNPLEGFTDDELRIECARRGFLVQPV